MTQNAPGPLLRVENLSLTAGPLTIVENASFSLGAGEVVGVVGESGSGKTMVARAVIRLLPDGIRQAGGRILLDDIDLASLGAEAMRKVRGAKVGLVLQEPMTSLNPAMTVGAQMTEALRMHGRVPSSAAVDRCRSMLDRVGIRDPSAALASYPHQFSGGMRQRIMLASTMMLKPRLLIADEPTTALDMLSQREVMDLMVELARDGDAAIMLITHDLGLVERYAQRAVVMRRGLVVEQGEVQQILRAPADGYTRTLVDAVHHRIKPPRRLPASDAPVLSARNLSVRYPGRLGWLRRAPGLLAVNGVSFDIRRGEVVAVVGGSGSGKTTLGRAVLGLLPVQDGTVSVRGVDLAKADRAARRVARLQCQLVFQDPQGSLDPRQRVEQIVAEPLRHMPGLAASDSRRLVDEMLDRVGLSGLGRRFPHALSGGQRQRVAIARAVIRKPALVVADEPVSALDMTVRRQVLELFRDLQEQHGFACLFISHDFAAVEQVADRVLVMRTGQVVEEGECLQVLGSPSHAYTRALLSATPLLGAAAVPAATADTSATIEHVHAAAPKGDDDLDPFR